jgi:hypothetical protein
MARKCAECGEKSQGGEDDTRFFRLGWFRWICEECADMGEALGDLTCVGEDRDFEDEDEDDDD